MLAYRHGITATGTADYSIPTQQSIVQTTSSVDKTLTTLLIGIAANGLWVIGLWAFLRALRVAERSIYLCVLCVAATGAIFLNTVYTWPKLLSAALLLGAPPTPPFRAGNDFNPRHRTSHRL